MAASDIKDNPFAGLLATQISPGAGLYIGLIGALIVAGALGFVAVGHLLVLGRMKAYVVTQSVSVGLGILLGFLVGPSGPPKVDTAGPKGPAVAWPFPGANRAANRAADQSKWKKSHNISHGQWDEMIANYKARKLPKSVTQTEWWEEAKDKTPAELNKLYPPLQPREWYRAEWPGGFSRSRELGFSFTGRDQKLKVEVVIRTEPDLPIKELYGHLAFMKGEEIVYETQVAEKPKVSFTDMHFVFLRIPYDDDNPKHRTLRFAKDSELTPVFTVRKVVMADGKEKTFE